MQEGLWSNELGKYGVLYPTWLFLMHRCMLTALRISQLRGLFNLLEFGVSGTYLIPEHLFCVNISHPLVELLLWKMLQPPSPWFCLPTFHLILFSLSCTSNIAAGLIRLEDNLSFATFHLKSHQCSCADYTMKSTRHHGLALSSVILPTMHSLTLCYSLTELFTIYIANGILSLKSSLIPGERENPCLFYCFQSFLTMLLV